MGSYKIIVSITLFQFFFFFRGERKKEKKRNSKMICKNWRSHRCSFLGNAIFFFLTFLKKRGCKKKKRARGWGGSWVFFSSLFSFLSKYITGSCPTFQNPLSLSLSLSLSSPSSPLPSLSLFVMYCLRSLTVRASLLGFLFTSSVGPCRVLCDFIWGCHRMRIRQRCLHQ